MHGRRVLAGDLLRSQVLLHGERIVGPAFHGRIVGDHHAGSAAHPADAGDEPRTRQFVVVDLLGRERRELEERRTGIEQGIHPLAHQKLARCAVLVARRRASALRIALQQAAQVRHQRLHGGAVGGEFGRPGSIFERILAMVLLPAIVNAASEVAQLSDSPIIQRFRVR